LDIIGTYMVDFIYLCGLNGKAVSFTHFAVMKNALFERQLRWEL